MKEVEEGKYDVVPDRPPSIDKEGRRLFIIPSNVTGYFRRRRSLFYSFLIFIFLVLPWTKFNGRQTVLLDIGNRKFIFFDTTFFSHDGPLVFFFLAIAAFGIVFFTAIWGRVWCGWACPQTVFIDFIYRRIEEWTEGNYIKRRRLDSQPVSLLKILRKTLKWILYLLASWHIAHSFTAYFVGSTKLLNITMGSPQSNWGLFLWVQIFTAILLVNFGWFREQFCLIVCPYGRFQSALMDENSLTILYDFNRGEPRKAKGVGKEEQGDCINCLRCVNSCPTGIDIRNGQQMECIDCTACADACDEIMEKVNKPKGLIRYASEAELNGKKRQKYTVRNIAYLALLLIFLVGAVFSVSRREYLEVKIIRAIQNPYQFADKAQSQVINHFRMHLTNQSNKTIGIKSMVLEEDNIEIVTPGLVQTIGPGKSAWVHIFFTFPASITHEGFTEVSWVMKYTGEEEGIKVGRLKLLAP